MYRVDGSRSLSAATLCLPIRVFTWIVAPSCSSFAFSLTTLYAIPPL